MAKQSDYNWLDDPFRENKPDPLDKGTGGCAGPAALIAIAGAIILVAAIAFFFLVVVPYMVDPQL